MKIVIYCRFSSELQNPKSLDDQEREIRAGLARLSIDASNAEVISDAAVSGTRTDRDGFDQIEKRIKNGEPFLLAVDDQSRFTRLGNAMSLITDLIFAGGRFISVCEQIDTKVEGWKLKVRGMELHHGACSDETANRVRRGQRGRVIDGKSAGDYGYGRHTRFGTRSFFYVINVVRRWPSAFSTPEFPPSAGTCQQAPI
jgi:site-specific DNA recombinase